MQRVQRGRNLYYFNLLLQLASSGKAFIKSISLISLLFIETKVQTESTESGDVCYVLLPEKMKEADMDWLEELVQKYPINIVAISGMNWNDMLTPWKAPALTPKESDFKGKAKNERLATVGT